jgi:hypothetical protein
VLKRLVIAAALIDNDESIQSMKLPQLRYLEISEPEWVRLITQYEYDNMAHKFSHRANFNDF